MKKFLVFLLIVPCMQGYSQIKKGSIIIDGSIYGNYYNQSSDGNSNLTNSSSYNIYFAPKLGFFIIDNFSLNIIPSLGFSGSKYESSVANEEKSFSSSYGLSLGINKYFGSAIIKPFIGSSIGLSRSISVYNLYYFDNTSGEEITQEDVKSFRQYFYTDLMTGVSYSINDKVSLDLFIDYTFRRINGKIDTRELDKLRSHNIYFGTGITVFI